MNKYILTFLTVAFAQADILVNLINNQVAVRLTNQGDYTSFDVQANVSITVNNFWLGVGLNSAPQMDFTDVVVCQRSGSAVSVQHYYNTDGASPPSYLDSTNTSIGLSNQLIQIENGIITCSFDRVNSLNNTRYFKLTQQSQAYIIVAYGSVDSSGNLLYHGPNKSFTNEPVSFSSNPASTTQGTTLAFNNQVGTFKIGSVTLNWLNSGTYTKFTIWQEISTQATNNYLAFAFSYDQTMGNDNVVSCILESNNGSIKHMYNQGRSTPVLLNSADSSTGLVNGSVVQAGNIFVCTVYRLKRLVNQSNYFDISKQSYYLLVATGSTSSGVMQYHTFRGYSDSMINFEQGGEFTGSTKTTLNSRTKAHGCLMAIAWLFFASAGIIIARYFKFIFPGKKILGNDVWLNLHRSIMAYVALITFIAFMVILADSDWEWVKESYDKIAYAHSLFGIMAISFTILQAIVAVFKPDKENKYRYIFNHFHRYIGILSFTLAVIAIWLAMFLPKMNLGSKGWSLMLVWTLWMFILPFTLEFIIKYAKNKSSKDDNETTDPQSQLKIIKIILLCVHLVALFAFTLAMVVLVGRASNDQS